MRGPQGVWIANNKLYVADTQNYRVLIWNSFPTTNNQAPDVVLGQPDFTTRMHPRPRPLLPYRRKPIVEPRVGDRRWRPRLRRRSG